MYDEILPTIIAKQIMDDCFNKAREDLEKRKYFYSCDIKVPGPWITYDNYIQPYAIFKIEKEK